MRLKAGGRHRSQVCSTEVMVIRPPSGDDELRCGGWPMVTTKDEPDGSASLDPNLAEGTQLGKRYSDEDGEIELLVVKAGQGTLQWGGNRLTLKATKPLPASD